MKLYERSITGPLGYKPTPTVVQLESPRACIIIQSWSDKKLIADVVKVIESELLRPKADYLVQTQVALTKAHEHILKNVNGESWKEAVQISILVFSEKNLFWSMSSDLSLYGLSEKKLSPIAVQSHLEGISPLPWRAVGMSENLELESGSCALQPLKQLILWDGPTPEASFWNCRDLNITSLHQVFLSSAEEEPGWISLIENLD